VAGAVIGAVIITAIIGFVYYLLEVKKLSHFTGHEMAVYNGRSGADM
jgi:uncharacterized membrane protein